MDQTQSEELKVIANCDTVWDEVSLSSLAPWTLSTTNDASCSRGMSKITGRYEGYISAYVDQCPFHLFDTERQRNISRDELKIDISIALKSWIKIPLTCSEVTKTILGVARRAAPIPAKWRSLGDFWYKDLDGYVSSTMLKNPLIDDEAGFISALTDELKVYHSMRVDKVFGVDIKSPLTPPLLPIGSILPLVYQLIERKRAQSSIPTHQEVHEQIALFGQYAILSHRWDEGQELSFADAANLSDPSVQAKTGFQKLVGFSNTVKSYYGCRYLWVDSVCIDETDRNASIPLMFGWYRHAYVCLIYLPTSQIPSADLWSARGWTLQEFLAASRLKCFEGDWRPHQFGFGETYKFDICRGHGMGRRTRREHDYLKNFTNVNWISYKPGVGHVTKIFQAMCTRKTKEPEDMVYCLLSALAIDIPVRYGEGFDSAFYRFQVKLLTLTNDRRLLLWMQSTSPYNSMLAGRFEVVSTDTVSGEETYRKYSILGTDHFDPTISFDSNGVMRIMVSLHPVLTSQSQPHVFALMGHRSWDILIGVLLCCLPGGVYQKIGVKMYSTSEISMDQASLEWVNIK